MKLKYFILLFSFFCTLVGGGILQIESIKADELAQFEDSIQTAKKALNLQIIQSLYFPILVSSHLLFLLLFIYKDKVSCATTR